MNENLDFNSFMQFMQNYYNQPLNPTRTAQYGLAQQGQANQLALGQGQQANDLSMFNTGQNNQMSQFNNNLALQQAQQLWEQQMGVKSMANQQQQQQWSNQNQWEQQQAPILAGIRATQAASQKPVANSYFHVVPWS